MAIMLPNGFDFPLAWLAAAKARAVVVPVNVAYRTRDLTHIVRHAGASVAITHGDEVPKLLDIQAACPALRSVADIAGDRASGRTFNLAERAARASSACDLAPLTASDLVTIQYTSGTTGFPKGCMLTHEYWLSLATIPREYAGLDAADVHLTAQPFSYMDPMWNLIAAMLAGAPLVILPRFSASTFWQSVRDNEATFFYCLGTMPLYLMKQPAQPEIDRSHRVRLVLCSGIPPHMHAAIEERWGCPWREVYGSTELGGVLAVPPDDATTVGTGAMGRPMAGREVRVVDADGADVMEGEVGELLVKGPAVMLGYWSDPDATAHWRVDGWARTGDLVYRDAGGYFHLVGRTKDMIRRGGENISAAEVESVLCEHPAVRAAACVAVPDELRGEEVKAFVQLQPGESARSTPPANLAAFLRSRIAPFKVPRYYEYVDRFPLTPSERIAKSELRTAKPDQRVGAFDILREAWG